MGNQAEKLRLKMENKHISTSIGVISGKGGVGKSNFSTNFSFNLAKKGLLSMLDYTQYAYF